MIATRQVVVRDDAPSRALRLFFCGEALRRDKTNAVGYEYLARAYAQTGREPDALLATAQMYYYNGAIKDARIFAARAQQGFKKGSPGWLRAGDIINSGAKPAKKS